MRSLFARICDFYECVVHLHTLHVLRSPLNISLFVYHYAVGDKVLKFSDVGGYEFNLFARKGPDRLWVKLYNHLSNRSGIFFSF